MKRIRNALSKRKTSESEPASSTTSELSRALVSTRRNPLIHMPEFSSSLFSSSSSVVSPQTPAEILASLQLTQETKTVAHIPYYLDILKLAKSQLWMKAILLNLNPDDTEAVAKKTDRWTAAFLEADILFAQAYKNYRINSEQSVFFQNELEKREDTLTRYITKHNFVVNNREHTIVTLQRAAHLVHLISYLYNRINNSFKMSAARAAHFKALGDLVQLWAGNSVDSEHYTYAYIMKTIRASEYLRNAATEVDAIVKAIDATSKKITKYGKLMGHWKVIADPWRSIVDPSTEKRHQAQYVARFKKDFLVSVDQLMLDCNKDAKTICAYTLRFISDRKQFIHDLLPDKGHPILNVQNKLYFNYLLSFKAERLTVLPEAVDTSDALIEAHLRKELSQIYLNRSAYKLLKQQILFPGSMPRPALPDLKMGNDEMLQYLRDNDLSHTDFELTFHSDSLRLGAKVDAIPGLSSSCRSVSVASSSTMLPEAPAEIQGNTATREDYSSDDELFESFDVVTDAGEMPKPAAETLATHSSDSSTEDSGADDAPSLADEASSLSQPSAVGTTTSARRTSIGEQPTLWQQPQETLPSSAPALDIGVMY